MENIIKVLAAINIVGVICFILFYSLNKRVVKNLLKTTAKTNTDLKKLGIWTEDTFNFFDKGGVLKETARRVIENNIEIRKLQNPRKFEVGEVSEDLIVLSYEFKHNEWHYLVHKKSLKTEFKLCQDQLGEAIKVKKENTN